MHVGSTLVVVADGAVGRFLLRERPGARLVEVDDLRMEVEEAEPERDRAPRTHDRFGGGRHKIEHRQSAHEAMEEKFLNHVLRRTIDVFRSEKSARLVLCAPPRALGVLRADLTADLRQHLALELDKDITKETVDAIDQRLTALRV